MAPQATEELARVFVSEGMNKPTAVAILAVCLVLSLGSAGHSQSHSFAIALDGATTGAAILTDTDIVEYRFAEHALTVNAGVLSRIPPLPLTGRAFHVMVDGQRIYSGLFVPNMSWGNYGEPSIGVGGEDRSLSTTTLTIRRAYYHEPRFQTGADLRSDERIRRALSALGKLTEGDIRAADYDQVLSVRIADLLLECKPIVPGVTREQLLKVFMAEGGLSSAMQQRFVHRRCPYIKLDVEFKLSDPKQKALEERLTDTVRKVSKPYLDWSIVD
jgi:hypothetical protein